MKKIKKAVLPVAGFGTRFLPATKAIPKEMLAIIDKPLIQYAVEEAVSVGAEEIIFITSHTKGAIENHFSSYPELEERLRSSNKLDLLGKLNPSYMEDLKFSYVNQEEQKGYLLSCILKIYYNRYLKYVHNILYQYLLYQFYI